MIKKNTKRIEIKEKNLGKKGPIYALEWNPVRDEFVVVYGSKN